MNNYKHIKQDTFVGRDGTFSIVKDSPIGMEIENQNKMIEDIDGNIAMLTASMEGMFRQMYQACTQQYFHSKLTEYEAMVDKIHLNVQTLKTEIANRVEIIESITAKLSSYESAKGMSGENLQN